MVSKKEFCDDLIKNYAAIQSFGIEKKKASYFLPPYEWYNDTIAAWTNDLNLTLVNYSPGTISHADYTTPDAPNYRDSKTIFQSILDFEEKSSSGLNGFILLMHIGTDPKRTDKFYHQLPKLLTWLQQKNYHIKRLDDLLKGPEKF